MFNNGKYNEIKFKVRENEGEHILEEKMKQIENIFNKKEYKISIKKDQEKKVNIREIKNNIEEIEKMDIIGYLNHLREKDIKKLKRIKMIMMKITMIYQLQMK